MCGLGVSRHPQERVKELYGQRVAGYNCRTWRPGFAVGCARLAQPNVSAGSEQGFGQGFLEILAVLLLKRGTRVGVWQEIVPMQPMGGGQCRCSVEPVHANNQQ